MMHNAGNVASKSRPVGAGRAFDSVSISPSTACEEQIRSFSTSLPRPNSNGFFYSYLAGLCIISRFLALVSSYRAKPH